MADTRYTHGHDESVLRSHRTRTVANSAAYLRSHLQPGSTVLDLGSGPGTITAEIADLVAPALVTAVENTELAMDLTRGELAARNVQNARYRVADIHCLPFAGGEFDVVHAHQVLQHVGDPVQALREMGRVCRPGGVVAVRDADYQAFSWYPELPELDQWLRIYRSLARDNGGEPDAGRRLLSWALAAGFPAERIEPTASIWCCADPARRVSWGQMWADRILAAGFVKQALEAELAQLADLQRISDAWRRWAAAPDGWLTIPHGELILHIG